MVQAISLSTQPNSCADENCENTQMMLDSSCDISDLGDLVVDEDKSPKHSDVSQSSAKHNQHTEIHEVSSSDISEEIGIFKFGPYVPFERTENGLNLNPKNMIETYHNLAKPSQREERLLSEILHDDTIIETASMVTPILLKKSSIWPAKYVEPLSGTDKNVESGPKMTSETRDPTSSSVDSDDIQIVKEIKIHAKASINEHSNNKKVEDYVHEATTALMSRNTFNRDQLDTYQPVLSIDNYYSSSAVNLLSSIGLSLAQEFRFEQEVKNAKRRIAHSRERDEEAIAHLRSTELRLASARVHNKPFKSQQKYGCHRCSFRSGTRFALDRHLESPHLIKQKVYLCNWCDYKDPHCDNIFRHTVYDHKKTCWVEKLPAAYQCRYCPYESRSKRSYDAHISVCESIFSSECIQSPILDDIYPGLTPKPITQEDIRIYDFTLKSIRCNDLRSFHINNRVRGPISLVPSQSDALAYNRREPLISHAIPLPSQTMGTNTNATKTNVTIQASGRSSEVMNHLATDGHALTAQRAVRLHRFPLPQQPFANAPAMIRSSSHIYMPPPVAPAVPIGPNASIIMRPNSFTQGGSSSTPELINLADDDEDEVQISPSTSTSVMPIAAACDEADLKARCMSCEICDLYMDETGLIHHMELIHDMKIMPRSRPPIKCVVCYKASFHSCDGLDRHMLGAHAIVTPHLQKKVDKHEDSGRCTVCGVLAGMIVHHMKVYHGFNPKNSNLIYECKSCSARYQSYELFTKHALRIHADLVK